MSIISNITKRKYLKEGEPPEKKLITEGDILIKQLATKQKITKITLNEYLQNAKSFEKANEQISVTSCHEGPASLTEFQSVIGRVKDIERLRSIGLDNFSIKLFLDYQNDNLLINYKNVEKSVLFDRIRAIENEIIQFDKLEDQVTVDRDSREINAKERDLRKETILKAKPNSMETKLLMFALNNESKRKNVLPNSLDCIKSIETEMFSHLNDVQFNPEKVQKRIRNIKKRIAEIDVTEQNNRSIESNLTVNSLAVESQWDKKIPPATTSPIQLKETKVYMCKPCNYYTIKEGEIIKLHDKVNRQVPEEKLTIEEIKKIPMFANYDCGESSKVLYVKNLPKNITMVELKKLFKCKEDVSFRVMSGMMRGQAFVTFPKESLAAVALENVNGLVLNGKPIVICYGKNKEFI